LPKILVVIGVHGPGIRTSIEI